MSMVRLLTLEERYFREAINISQQSQLKIIIISDVL